MLCLSPHWTVLVWWWEMSPVCCRWLVELSVASVRLVSPQAPGQAVALWDQTDPPPWITDQALILVTQSMEGNHALIKHSFNIGKETTLCSTISLRLIWGIIYRQLNLFGWFLIVWSLQSPGKMYLDDWGDGQGIVMTTGFDPMLSFHLFLLWWFERLFSLDCLNVTI